MPVSYNQPGVYIEEIPKFPPSVVAVETAIPAFFGYTVKARKARTNDLHLVPIRINSLTEFEKYFGAAVNEKITAVIDDVITKAGALNTLTSRTVTIKTSFLKNCLHYQLQLFFANGGGPCYIVSIGKANGLFNKTDYIQGIDKLKTEDEPTLLVFPDIVHLPDVIDRYGIYNHALEQAAERGDRFVIMDVYHEGKEQTAIDLFRNTITGGQAAGSLKYGAAYYPILNTHLTYRYVDRAVKIMHNILTKEQGVADKKSKGEFDRLRLNDPKLAGTTAYTQIKNQIEQTKLLLPPSAAIAGIYAEVDRTKGVWKAPANISLAMVQSPSVQVTEQDQQGLNIDITAGKSINTIRAFTGKGTLVWGARTLAGNDNEWRYISVRRFFNMVEESIKKATAAFVFEPNDSNTWVKIKAMIENFLTLQWRQGGLQGSKPEHAFFVKAGLNQTMTMQDIADGRLITEIGLAVVRPAEFIIIRILQKMQQP